MRYFNIYGPVNEQDHYVVPRTELVEELLAQIEEGRFFTIYASRQMGKTTLLRRLRDELSQKEEYLPVLLSLSDYESLPVEQFLPAFWPQLCRSVISVLKSKNNGAVESVQKLLDKTPENFVVFRLLLEQLYDAFAPQRFVLIIDEFDGVPQPVIGPLLQVCREIYLENQPPRSLHSIIFVGLQNIATLNLGRSSPFNIARQINLKGFSTQQVVDMLAQYEQETGQPFASGVKENLAQLTGGHPFLVNRVGVILTEDIATDHSLPITRNNLTEAERQIMRERNFNFETLGRHAQEYPNEILDILFGKLYQFNLNNPIINELNMHGIVTENDDGFCDIANPIYRQVLIAYLRPLVLATQGDLLLNGHDARVHAQDGRLDMPTILSNFRIFVERRGREAFKISPMPQEATGQYLLMAYLESIVQQTGGAVFTEAPSGGGLLDLIVSYEKERYIIETKIWRGPKQFEEGLDQLANYLDVEGQTTGYYVVFHARPSIYGKLTDQELESLQSHNGKDIHVYLVRLGQVFADSAEDDS